MEQEGSTKEIDFIEIFNSIIRERKKIYILLLIFTFFGLFIALFTPNQYTTSTIFVPQGADGNKVSSNLGGLAAIAGINIGSGASESGIPLSLYSQILHSIPFQRELVKTPITIKGLNQKVTYEEYYKNYHKPGLLENIKKYTIGLPGVLVNNFKNKDNKQNNIIIKDSSVIYITDKEKELFNQLETQLILKVKEQDNSVEIIGIMPEAIAVAELTSNAQKLLEKYIINFKVEKSSSKLNFIRKRYLEKEGIYKKKQMQLANFQDRNKFSISAKSQSRLVRLQSEYDLAYNIYNELATQIETQQIQVKEDTPIFTIIKPASVPLTKYTPNRLVILLTWMITGIILGALLVLGRKYYLQFKEHLINV